jgi:hypothetical protein
MALLQNPSRLALFTLASVLGLASGLAEDFRLESAGVRSGFSMNHRTEDFKQTEAFVYWELPCRWELFSDLQIQWRLDVSAGWLSERGDAAALVTGGPSGVLQWRNFPISLEAGCSRTILSRDEVGSKDFGTPFQFTSHGGANLDFGSHWRLGYRFQHMSNAHLSHDNPGLNLHMFAASWRF